jgi:hypothetical protein
MGKEGVRTTTSLATIVLMGVASCMLCADVEPARLTVKGYVIDSACAFTKHLSKPISKQCAVSCAKLGSSLVILADDGTIYWPIANNVPAAGQNEKLLPFAAQKVVVSGKVFTRGGSHAMVIETIEPESKGK